MITASNIQIFSSIIFLALVSCFTPEQCKLLDNLKCTDFSGNCTQSISECFYFSGSSTAQDKYQPDGALCKYNFQCLHCCNNNSCSSCSDPSGLSDSILAIIIIVSVIGGIGALFIIYKIIRQLSTNLRRVQPPPQNLGPRYDRSFSRADQRQYQLSQLFPNQQSPNHQSQTGFTDHNVVYMGQIKK